MIKQNSGLCNVFKDKMIKKKKHERAQIIIDVPNSKIKKHPF